MKAGQRRAKQVEMVEEVLLGQLVAKLLEMVKMGMGGVEMGGVLEVPKMGMGGLLEGDLLLGVSSLHYFCLAHAALGEYSMSFNLAETPWLGGAQELVRRK